MVDDTRSRRKAQLDEAEREHLEGVVTSMRERVEDNVRYQLRGYDLEERPGEDASLRDAEDDLVAAIESETDDGDDWTERVEQYVTGVGYTVVNRLAALRCMEVRGFLKSEVTVFTERGLTAAAETLVREEFLPEDEAILAAYHRECDDLAAEIEILFDRSTAYSLVDPDADAFEDLCRLLDAVPDAVWRADDVLGWVYEYYNVTELSDVRTRAHRGEMTPDDVSVANQFYTPHWVVRMLVDNSLGKRYLEGQGELADAIAAHDRLSPADRKRRSDDPSESSSVADLCTYVTDGTGAGTATDPVSPAELRVVDPACGSGHFLLYAFDVLERIWWAERPDVDRAAVPAKVLEHNLYGVDVDLRSCQLAAFTLYLKARERAEAEGADAFNLPSLGVVCADATVADVDDAAFDAVAEGRPYVREALEQLLTEFEDVDGLGSLLDVRGALAETVRAAEEGQRPTRSEFCSTLRDAVGEGRDDGSFLARDLRSFLRLLVVLAQDYDVALMNPPYGSGKRMPDPVQAYVRDNYDYYPEYYINFFEVCERLTRDGGRIGMIVPRTFMFKRSFEGFREEFVGGRGTFDFLAEFGDGVLDNATVRTVGTVVRTETDPSATGRFIRLHDVPAGRKEETFLDVIGTTEAGDGRRVFEVDHSEFAEIPGTPICYYAHPELRALHGSAVKVDPEKCGIDARGVADVVQGLATGDNQRFLRAHHEVGGDETFVPYAKGGTDAYVLPEVGTRIRWAGSGSGVRRFEGSVMRNEDYYGRAGLTWSYIKETGRRFGYFPGGGAFDVTGSMLFPRESTSGWTLIAVLNSDLYHGLFLSLTPERDWQVETVSRIPWFDAFEAVDGLEDAAREQYRLLLAEESYDPASPYFAGPELLPAADCEFFYGERPAVVPLGDPSEFRADVATPDSSIREAAEAAERARRTRRARIERLASEVDSVVFDALDVSDDARDSVREEIRLRTKAAPADRAPADVDDARLAGDVLETKVEYLLHYCLLSAVRDQGIVPLYPGDAHRGPVEAIRDELEAYFGDHADDRLAEIDGIVGSRSPVAETYPNVRDWVETEFFAFHVDQFEQRPIVWRLDTASLTSEDGRGFACFVDYDSVDGSLFDRIQSRFLEARTAALRELRNAAERRRSDDSLSASERATAAEAYDRRVTGLRQIELFEAAARSLASATPRDWSPGDRDRAAALSSLVASFRAETERILDTLDRLRERADEAWLADTFSPTFFETVAANRAEWVDALADLERACDAYARPADEPVAAHHYDLFPYFKDLAGSAHYASSGVLFVTYYVEREGARFLDGDGRPKDGLQDQNATLLADLAAGTAAYRELAGEIDAGCQTLAERIPADWETRALSEITTAGYRPKRKHGVAVNFRPLAEAGIVPDIVDERVL